VSNEEGQRPTLDMVKVNDAAEILGVSRRQVYRLVEDRAIPHVHLGGCVRFERGVLVQWVLDQMMKGVKEHGRSEARKPLDRGLVPGTARRSTGAIPPFSWADRYVKTAG